MHDPEDEEQIMICPKCRYDSGNDWSQCEGKCPIKMSPHYDEATHSELGDLRSPRPGEELQDFGWDFEEEIPW